MQINIGITDDQLLFRKGMVSLLKKHNGFNVLWEAANGLEALSMLKEHAAETSILLLDLNMPGIDGMQLMRQVKKEYPEMKVIILSIQEEDRFIFKLIELGANSYLSKSASLKEVENSIKITTDKGFYFNDRISGILFNNVGNIKKRSTLTIDFTRREQEVLQYICEEFSTKDIAKKLFISERTVEGHRNNLILKTNVKNTAGLVIYAIKSNLIDLNFYLK